MFGLTPSFRKQNNALRANNIWDLRNVFDDFINDSFLPEMFTGAQPIKADIRENEKEYIVDAEIPGVNKEDIKLELLDNTLTISVDHNEETEEKTDTYIRRERKSGSFARSFYVKNVNRENVTAKYNNGILSIILPKNESEEKTNKIDIQ